MKIISMGDYRMDDQDRRLREMFAHAPLADDGFSARAMRRVRRQERLRRWLVPTAWLAGLVIGAAPLLRLFSDWMLQLQPLLQATAGTGGQTLAPSQNATMLLAVVLVSAMAVAVRLLEE